MDILKDIVDKYSIRRDKSLLDLPEKTVINEYVELDSKQEKFYTNIVNGVKEEADKVDLKTYSLLAMLTRVRQATSCPSILTTEDIRSSKIDRAVELTQDITLNNEKVVIFSEYKETLNVIKKMLKDVGIESELCTGDVKEDNIRKSIEEFQTNPECKVILATSKKLGTGVTLTAGSYVIFIDCPWTKADCQQCEDRIHRVGSKKPVFIYYLWNSGTIDERVKEVVDSKEAIADFIIDNKIIEPDILRKLMLDL